MGVGIFAVCVILGIDEGHRGVRDPEVVFARHPQLWITLAWRMAGRLA